MRVTAILLLPLAALLSGCAAQRHSAASGRQAYETALAALETQRFVIEIDDVYGKKGKKADTHQSYVRMKDRFAEFNFAPDFFRPSDTKGTMSHYRASDENACFEKIRTKRNGDVQFQIQGRLDWRKMGGRCLVTLFHDSERVSLDFFDYLNRPYGTAKGVVHSLKE